MLKLDGASTHSPRSQARRTLEFARPWLVGAASAAYLFSVGWIKPRNRATIVDLSEKFGYRHNSRVAPELPVVDVESVAAHQTTVDLREPQAADGNVSELELIVLARIVREAQPQCIFELGTFDGRTTLNLAANAPSARLYTIDLPSDSLDQAKGIDPQEVQFVQKPVSGARFAGTDMVTRITQLYGDSGTYDFSAYYDAVDLVFVDASHAYEYVINDSLHALKMLRGGRGTIVWHDYSRWDGVTAALNDLRNRHGGFRDAQWITGTTLAFLRI